VVRDLPVLREVFGDTVAYASDPPGLAAAIAAALTPTARGGDEGGDGDGGGVPDRREAGRRLARAHRWDDVAAAHLRFYETVLRRPRPAPTGLPSDV
jgi:hypothetical protein